MIHVGRRDTCNIFVVLLFCVNVYIEFVDIYRSHFFS